jgi:CBS domain containing-hemolysin-like protein
VLTPLWVVIGLAVCAAASFFFALAESALFSLSRWQIRQFRETSGARGLEVGRLLSHPKELLATIVLGNTLANSGLIALVLVWGLRAAWVPWVTMLALVGILLLILIGCEAVPKTLAVRAPDRWSVRVSRPMICLFALSRPLRAVAQRLNEAILRAAVPSGVQAPLALSDEEYQELIELAYQQGTLAATEKEIILQIISLDRRTARDVMRPRARMACIPDDLTVEEMIAEARKHRHRRLPMYDETADTIVGVLNTRSLLLDPGIDLAEAIEFPSFVPESMNLLQLLRSLQRQQRGLAIVLDECGSTAGLVTLEDILEAMVGEIRGEGADQGFILERLGPGRWRVNGAMRIEDFRREYPGLGMVKEVDTLGGLLTHQLQVVPQPGDSTVFRGLKLSATSADERRVRELLVEVVGRRGGAA